VTARYEAEIGHYGTEVTQRRLERAFRLPDVSLEWDNVDYQLDADGRLNIEIRLAPARPYKCDQSVEELELVPVGDVAMDLDSLTMENADSDEMNDDGAQLQQPQQLSRTSSRNNSTARPSE
jgi:hypothetical protein